MAKEQKTQISGNILGAINHRKDALLTQKFAELGKP